MAADRLQVVFDLHIILDVLQVRKEFYEFSARLLAYAETGTIQGCIDAYSVTTLFYLECKLLAARKILLAYPILFFVYWI